MNRAPHDTPASRDHETGVPGLRTWRGVYVFVLGTFVVIVALLAMFTHSYR